MARAMLIALALTMAIAVAKARESTVGGTTTTTGKVYFSLPGVRKEQVEEAAAFAIGNYFEVAAGSVSTRAVEMRRLGAGFRRLPGNWAVDFEFQAPVSVAAAAAIKLEGHATMPETFKTAFAEGFQASLVSAGVDESIANALRVTEITASHHPTDATTTSQAPEAGSNTTSSASTTITVAAVAVAVFSASLGALIGFLCLKKKRRGQMPDISSMEAEIGQPTRVVPAGLVPQNSCLPGLEACAPLVPSSVVTLEIINFDITKDRHVFVPPMSNALAAATLLELGLIEKALMSRGQLSGPERLRLKIFLEEQVGTFLEMYAGQVHGETVGIMRDIALHAGEDFLNTYLDALRRSKDNDPQGVKAFPEMVATLCRHCEALTQRKPKVRQETNDVVELFHHAVSPRSWLQDFADEVAESCGGRVVLSKGERVGLKHFWRAMEKTAFEPNAERRFEANRILDVARDGLEFADYGSMERAIQYICTSDAVEVMRIKDRISSVEKATVLGWTDVMINLRFHNDANRHICELQLFHETSMKCRSVLGGHSGYRDYRSIAELFERNQIPLKV